MEQNCNRYREPQRHDGTIHVSDGVSQGHGDRLVSRQFLDDIQVDARLRKTCCKGVPEVMLTDVRKACPFSCCIDTLQVLFRHEDVKTNHL
jgi:hypothetical protein